MFYRAGAAFVFGSFGSKGVVQFSELDDTNHDTEVILCNLEQVDENGKLNVLRVRHNIRRDAYMYICFFVALVGATPVSWRRKGWALFWGLILIHFYIAAKLLVHILEAFSGKPLFLFVPGPFWNSVLTVAHLWLINLTFGFAVAIVIWILVSFRREDWSKIAM